MRETEKRIKDLEVEVQSLKTEISFLRIAVIIHFIGHIIIDLI